jgi:hypothetical protein
MRSSVRPYAGAQLYAHYSTALYDHLAKRPALMCRTSLADTPVSISGLDSCASVWEVVFRCFGSVVEPSRLETPDALVQAAGPVAL